MSLILLLIPGGCEKVFSRLDEAQFVYRSFEFVLSTNLTKPRSSTNTSITLPRGHWDCGELLFIKIIIRLPEKKQLFESLFSMCLF